MTVSKLFSFAVTALKFMRCLLGFGRVSDNSICWFSAKFFDVHDYFKTQGGDGVPTHFHVYTCPACSKRFSI